ncbi:MAG: hypothetical protein JXX14_08100 [Deltaproteobacteria bacterium]|nr:hypothetical protein [Deltaproteobacteria bacterium]
MIIIKKNTSFLKTVYRMVPVLLAMLITVSLNVWGQAVKPRLFVYVNTMTKASALQKDLQGALPGAEVKVFSRIRDFEKAVSEESPEAVIARKNLVQSVKLKPGLQGVLNGKNVEPYVLLSVDKSIDASTLGGKNVGAVDEFGRKQTSNFVSKSLGVEPMLKRTVKVEDLLALLQFSAADAIFLPKRFTPILQKSSQLKLVETDLPSATMPLPAVGFASDEVKTAISSSIKSLNGSINQKLGVDSWQ